MFPNHRLRERYRIPGWRCSSGFSSLLEKSEKRRSSRSTRSLPFSHLLPAFFPPLLSLIPDHPRRNDSPGELPASFSCRVALPLSSDFSPSPLPRAARLFPSFSFSQSTSNFLDAAQAKRQHRIAQRPAPLARPGIDAEARSLHFYETLRTLRRPVGTDRPTDPPFPFPFLHARFTRYEHSVAARVLFGALPWNSCATIYSKSIFRLSVVLSALRSRYAHVLRVRVRKHMQRRCCRCAKKLREPGRKRGDTRFFREYTPTSIRAP